MMSIAQKGFLGSIRWKLRNDSSVKTPLLCDGPPEIELSDYRRLSGSDCECPSELLSGEGPKVELIADLDLFFERLYNYHREKGLLCIMTKWIVELLTVAFVVGFIWFFLLVVDWHALRTAKCGMEAVESGQKPCNLAKEAINHHPFVPFTFVKGVIVGSMVILTIYGLFNFIKLIVQFKNILKIRHFYYNSLNTTDRDMGTLPWPTVLDKVVQLQKNRQLCVVKELSAHDIIMRIMRKENYLIGMLNKGVLALPISCWVPGTGPPIKSEANGSKNHLIFPKTLEWTLNWCIFQSMFDSKFCIQRDFLTNPSLLRKRLVAVGTLMFIISPCLVIFMLVYLFLRHAEQFYNHPSTASSRRWSNLSKWIFREFNEVDHFFKHRLNNSVAHSSNYLRQFPSPLLSTIAKFISFVSGGFAAILIIIAFLDESLLEGHIFGRNLLWYAAVFGTLTALSRAAVTDELQVMDPEGMMAFVVQQTHYFPKRWRGRENSNAVRAEFETLFQYTGMMLLEEMASIFVTPYLLIFVIPKRVDDILQFISDFTVDVEGVGHVCSFSMFDFEKHGNGKYASPFDAPHGMRSSQGKMEKSFLSFQDAYASWEPTAHGQQFLSKLRHFGEQRLRDEIVGSTETHSSLQERTHRFRYRDVLHNDTVSPLSPCKLTTYLSTLDSYYASQTLHQVNNTRSSPQFPHGASFGSTLEQRQSNNKPPNEREVEDEGDTNFDINDRLLSNLEASTSSPFLQGNSLHQYAADHRALDHWWARSGPRSSDRVASFLDPPVFNHHSFRQHSDDLSDRSAAEQEGSDLRSTGPVASFLDPLVFDHHNFGHRGNDFRSLWRTTYVDDSDGDEGLGLHFVEERKEERSRGTLADVLGSPSATLPVRIIPRSNDPVGW